MDWVVILSVSDFIHYLSSGIPKRRFRISRDLHRLACDPKTPDILPEDLRPILENVRSPVPCERLTGNIIVDVTKCEQDFNTSI